MKKIILTFVALATLATTQVSAQTPLWQGKGRIAISSDGNEHDDDDWAATPLTLALIASQGLQDEMVLYTYSDHVWGNNIAQIKKHGEKIGESAYEQMRKSALGGKEHFGFDNSKFICAVDNPEVAYNAMTEVINASTAADPLIIIAAGPMQVVGEALHRADKEKLKYVTVLSHSNWNNMHSDRPSEGDWDSHSGWTFKEMIETFSPAENGGAKFVQIVDQNRGADYVGLFAPVELFDWIKTSEARNNPAYKAGSWDWLYERIGSCIKHHKGVKSYDPSDAGMAIYMFTGIEKTSPDMARELMENPVVRK